MRPELCVLGVLVTLVGASINAAGQGSGGMLVDLSTTEPGEEPAWRTGNGTAGKWAIAADLTAANGRALAQLSNDRTGYRFPLAIYKPYTGKDLELSVRFKAVAGTVDEAGGIVVRLSTADDYYVARANALEDNVRFYRVVKCKREQLAGADLKVSANQWHTLSLRAEGDRFTVSFDGSALFSARDPTFQDAGKIALWTKADSVTYFDTISVVTLE
jgi:hypothetical protein